MKKIFIVLSTLALAIGCQVFEPETPVAPVTVSEAPAIAISEVGDSSFVATITPAAGTGYYSYAIYEGDAESVSLSASTIFYVDKNALYSGTSKEEKVVVKTSDLKPYTSYVVAAVAASTQGQLNETVAVKQISTSDAVAPYITNFATQDTIAAIQWSEAVEVAKDVEILVYGINDSNAAYTIEGGKITGVGEPLDSYTIPAADVIVKGDITYIFVAGLEPGACYQVVLPAGFVNDAAGIANENAHEGYCGVYKGKFCDLYQDLYEADFDEYIDYISIYGSKAATTFDLPEFAPVIAPGQWEDTTFKVAVASPYGALASISKVDVNCTVEYNDAESYSISTKFNSSTLAYCSKSCICYTIPAEPGYGYFYNISIAEGAFADVYGNTSTAWESKALYSYGFTIDDLVGEYSCTVSSIFGASYDDMETATFKFEASDSVGFNIVCTEWFGHPAAIYGNFNFDNGEITLGTLKYTNSGAWLDDVEMDGYVLSYYAMGYFETFQGMTDPFAFYLTESGVISSYNDYCGWFYFAYAIPEGGIEAIDWSSYDAYNYNCYKMTSLLTRGEPSSPAAVKCSLPRTVERVVL